MTVKEHLELVRDVEARNADRFERAKDRIHELKREATFDALSIESLRVDLSTWKDRANSVRDRYDVVFCLQTMKYLKRGER